MGGSTVYRTKRRFVEGNLERALSEDPRPGAQRKLTGKKGALLVATACANPPEGRARWTLELLADAMINLTGHESLQATIAPGQKIKVESTAHGTSGRFYDMVETAKAKLASGVSLTVLDFKLHFYAWYFREDYRVQSAHVIITQELLDYFADIEVNHGIILDGDQMAWYQQKLNLLGWDDIKSEFPSHIGELFSRSLEGVFFKREMTKARASRPQIHRNMVCQ